MPKVSSIKPHAWQSVKPPALSHKPALTPQTPTQQRPFAPAVYRPQPAPKVLQRKTGVAPPPQRSQPLHKTVAPLVPPVYRPQPVPKVLQRKSAGAGQPLDAKAHSQPKAPPVYRPAQKKIVQPKIAVAAEARKEPTAPPVYRPQLSAAQAKLVRAGGARPGSKDFKAPHASRPGHRHACCAACGSRGGAGGCASSIQRSRPGLRPLPVKQQGGVVQRHTYNMYPLNQEARVQTAKAAVEGALPIVDNALSIVGRANNGQSADENHFERWFGTQSDNTGVVGTIFGQVKNLLQDNLTIRDADNDWMGECSEGVVAYSRHGIKTINICKRFYVKSAQDRAATIVHELTHVAADTDDYDGIGEDKALNRAKGRERGDPKHCAYNYEYFATRPLIAQDDSSSDEVDSSSSDDEVPEQPALILNPVPVPIVAPQRERLFTMPADEDERSEIWADYHNLVARKKRLQERDRTKTSEYTFIMSRLDNLWWKYGVG